ncbi:bola-like protein-domain-containing protein [Gautieria morchelliformis]|nr:bola-like protein-domain-containing protein [Gautieria morchelliformis]
MRYLRFPISLPQLRSIMSATNLPGPVETSIRDKLTNLLSPVTLIIKNDSWQHRHHEAMRQNQGSAETHFSVQVVSAEFKGKNTMQRHRMIYSTLSEEFSNGLHALSLKTKAPEEVTDSGEASAS